jgi:predicted DNA-binding protein YlxM (UPF0122 family)
MKVETTKLIRISTYARRAEITVQAVYEQIKRGNSNLQVVEIDGMTFVKLPENTKKG